MMQGVQRSKIEAMKAEGKEEASSLILDSAQNALKVGFIHFVAICRIYATMPVNFGLGRYQEADGSSECHFA